ncbi:type II secretion system F family protein [Pseudomonas sp. GCM10022188]|uniref:type II secretion system F family protein n=1 Tax=Pseudomonas TaxID=286 RepID=UPI001E5737C6|nr:type II secretion system F family protein [Pseudomonas oryzagri]MCC6075957.1 type II secretion system F family protein [Pseudomonas oryzagri]
MDYLLSLLNGAVGNEGVARLLFVGAMALSAVLAVVTVALLVFGLQDPVQRRLRGIKTAHAGSGQGAPSNLQLMLAQVGERFAGDTDWQNSSTRTLLMHAGFRQSSAAQVYWSARLLLILILMGIVVLALPFIKGVSLLWGGFLMTLAAGIGWLLPAIYVDKRKSARIRSLRAAFPDALDLLVVCVESGLALPQSIERVAQEMTVSHAELAEELALVNAEIRAGISSTEALRHLAERTGLDDINGLVSLLAQSIRFGTSVADTLRVYAEEFRDRRMQAAEEQAAKLGTKLVFPLIFCLWPSFFLVVIGPVIIGVLRAFGRL